MGRKAERSGVSPLGKDRIRFNFEFEGKRYRPSIERAPTEGNLNRALKQLDGIKERIARGTFSFESIRYSDLSEVANDFVWAKKTYNNAISVIRCASELWVPGFTREEKSGRTLKSAADHEEGSGAG